LAFTPAGQLVAGSNDRTVRVIQPSDGAILSTIDVKQEVLSIDVSHDGRYLATAVPVKIWDLASGQALTKEIRALGNNGLAFSPDGQFLATAEPVGGARVLSVPYGERRQSLNIDVQKRMKGPAGYVQESFNMPASAVAFSADGTWLATGGTEFGVQLWRMVNDSTAKTPTANSPTRVLTGHSMTVTGVSFSPNGKLLASASLDRTVRVWQLE
jgi:WD40 repeat protein